MQAFSLFPNISLSVSSLQWAGGDCISQLFATLGCNCVSQSESRSMPLWFLFCNWCCKNLMKKSSCIGLHISSSGNDILVDATYKYFTSTTRKYEVANSCDHLARTSCARKRGGVRDKENPSLDIRTAFSAVLFLALPPPAYQSISNMISDELIGSWKAPLCLTSERVRV